MTTTTKAIHQDPGAAAHAAGDKPAAFSGIAQEVLDELNRIGFDRPVEFLLKYNPYRVNLAVQLVRSKPAGQIRNPAGFIRFMVSTPGRIPVVQVKQKTDKYENQKYGGLVQR